MKEFNLDAALNGEPVMLRNRTKAFVLADVRKLFAIVNDKHTLIGAYESSIDRPELCNVLTWDANGKSYVKNLYAGFDIVGMWEEQKQQIQIEDLPKPFKPKDGESYFYITGGIVEYEDDYWDSNKFDKSSAERGSCYRTREDAQKWLDFMKSMME